MVGTVMTRIRVSTKERVFKCRGCGHRTPRALLKVITCRPDRSMTDWADGQCPRCGDLCDHRPGPTHTYLGGAATLLIERYVDGKLQDSLGSPRVSIYREDDEGLTFWLPGSKPGHTEYTEHVHEQNRRCAMHMLGVHHHE